MIMNKIKELMLRKKQRIVDSMKEQESLFTKKIEEIEDTLEEVTPDVVAEIPEDVVVEMPAKAKAAKATVKKKRSKKK